MSGKGFIFGVAVMGSIMFSSNATAEWWRKNLEQYSYNVGEYNITDHIIDAKCDLEKGYSHRIMFEAALDKKVRSFGYDDKAMIDVLYRVISFEQNRDERDFASGICRVEVLFSKSTTDSPLAGGGLFSDQAGDELISPQPAKELSFPQSERR